ncbi:hypothetical protein Btru_068186 [Bulinus truncatus]|nr:hypothetical protein Btru_068186 [Bulinus truncatus]
MSSKIKRGMSWAWTTLQVSQKDSHDMSVAIETSSSTYLNYKASERSDSLPQETRSAGLTFTRQEVADHCSSESCWMVVNNKVYDVTRFLRLHPGGEDIILEYAGHDATSAFIDKGHSLDAFDMLAEYCIGEVTKKDWLPERNYT